MPVDIVRWCAEIGIFNVVSERHMSSNIHFTLIKKLLCSLCLYMFYLIALSVFVFYSSGDLKLYFLNEYLLYPFIGYSIRSLIVNFMHCSLSFFCISHRKYFYFILLSICYILVFVNLLLIICGDIETNPGPNDTYNLSLCHWNLNSIMAHNFSKLTALAAFNSIHKFDIICLSETFLNSSYKTEDDALALNGYTLIRADHPDDIRRGGVCIYYKEALPIKIININYLSECLVCEISFNKKQCFIISLYRSPSQTTTEFNDFLLNFEQLLKQIVNLNPFMYVILGDFNARSSSWWTGDINSVEGMQIESLTSYYSLSQVISDPTHILPGSSSCIDLIFTNQPNLIIHSGVNSSLHPSCHHQITFAKINFKIEFPPPYQRLVWDYNKANTDAIKTAINNFDWVNAFSNVSVNKQVEILNCTILNIFSNFIPNKLITIDDSEPPWMTDFVKSKIKYKNNIFSSYVKNGRTEIDYQKLQDAITELAHIVTTAKENYYMRLGSKLSNPKTSAKSYWSILKSFYMGKKIPIIPPLLVDDNLVTNFEAKANIFNDFFSKQCSILDNASVLPQHLSSLTKNNLSYFDFNNDDILKLIRDLDSSKAHGHDGISIRMLKLCDNSIVKPLMIIFNNCLNDSVFPEIWKKGNIVPIHKKGDKRFVSNYRPVSLLPICGKIFERLIYNSLFVFLNNNDLLTPMQSGFRPGDSCINQLIAITHNIYASFDANPSLEVRGVFLDISKAFDRVWHDGLLFKLKCNGVCGNVFKLIKSFLTNRHQRVLLNGQMSQWAKVTAGVPQGSILGPLFFLIYINDIPNGLKSDVKLFADDTSLFSLVNNPQSSAKILNEDLDLINKWAFQWKMSFNPDITKQAQEVLFSRKTSKTIHPDLTFNNSVVQKASSQKHLGLILDQKLTFNQHLKEKFSKATKGIGVLRKLSHYLPRSSLVTIYKSFIRPHLDYGDVIYDQPNNATYCDKIETIQYNAALAITGAIRGTSKERLYEELGLEFLSSRRWFRRLCLFHKIFTTKSPSYLHNLIPANLRPYNTRHNQNISEIFCRTQYYRDSFFPYVISEWNKLDIRIRQYESFNMFRSALLKFIRPSPNSAFLIRDRSGLKLLTRLRLGLSHLREHKFNHNFRDTQNPLCPCSLETESVSHFFLRCHSFNQIRMNLKTELHEIDETILDLPDNALVNLLLYGDKKFDIKSNTRILLCSIKYILESKRFDEPLL